VALPPESSPSGLSTAVDLKREETERMLAQVGLAVGPFDRFFRVPTFLDADGATVELVDAWGLIDLRPAVRRELLAILQRIYEEDPR
jgi:hypothetical protein